MNEKILAFVCDGEKFLLLRNNSEDPAHGGDYWFTVTGGVEGDESLEEAVVREIKEETNLDTYGRFNLNWGSTYEWKGEEFKEMNFIAFVKKEKVILNEEHTDFEWFDLDDFVKKIKWNDNKVLLKKVLTKGMAKERYFDKKERGQ